MTGRAWDLHNWARYRAAELDLLLKKYNLTRPIKHEKWHIDATRATVPEPAPAGKEDDDMSPQQLEDLKAWQREMFRQEITPVVRMILTAINEDDLSEEDKAWAREMTRQEIGGALHS